MNTQEYNCIFWLVHKCSFLTLQITTTYTTTTYKIINANLTVYRYYTITIDILQTFSFENIYVTYPTQTIHIYYLKYVLPCHHEIFDRYTQIHEAAQVQQPHIVPWSLLYMVYIQMTTCRKSNDWTRSPKNPKHNWRKTFMAPHKSSTLIHILCV